MIESVSDDFDTRLGEIEARHERISADMAEPGVATDPERLRSLGKAYAELDEIVAPYREYREAMQQAGDARELAARESDAEMVAFLEDEAEQAETRAAAVRARLEALLVPKDPNDGKDLIVEIRAGAGGQEAALWAGELFEMYRRLAERHRWKTDVLSSSPSDLGGFKDAVLEVRGRNAYARLKHESGVHRVQRVPVTESSGRIHTSTATIAVLPEAEEVDVEIRPEDLVIDVYRSSGPGGQSVNTTDSAVRITHIPSGLVAACQNERSQMQNKAVAMRILKARLAELERQRREQEMDSIRGERKAVDFGSQIRSYVLAPYQMVKDHRTDEEMGDPQRVLDGDIDRFIEAELRRRASSSD